jgi:metal-responsive CopG/Arc/MetJ family transcriptional regulator
MKSHISATIEEYLVRDLEAFSRQEHRTKSQVIEMAPRQFLSGHRKDNIGIIASDASFEGTFNRAECYDR